MKNEFIFEIIEKAYPNHMYFGVTEKTRAEITELKNRETIITIANNNAKVFGMEKAPDFATNKKIPALDKWQLAYFAGWVKGRYGAKTVVLRKGDVFKW